MSSVLAAFLVAGLLTVRLATSVSAQTVNAGDGPRGNRGNLVEVPLPNNGTVIFNPNGLFAVTSPGFVVGVSAAAPVEDTGKSPGLGTPTPNIDPNLSALMDELVFNARHCLTLAGLLCEPGTPPAGAFNYVSTRVDIRLLAQQAAQDTEQDIAIPGMVLRSNPPEGLVNFATYFWVDRATYNGQTYFQQVVLPDPWSVDWDYWVTHSTTSPCPTDDDPGATCTTTTRVQEHHHEDHMDIVNVIVTLTPAHYMWTFGDEGRADFSDGTGIGVPYSPDVLCCPSLVEHNYRQSSLRVFEAGGFPVHLEATWTTNAIIHATRDGADVLNETVALSDRVGDYDLRYQVRESQPVLVQ